jgi:DNA-binding transcriptional MerR regulator
MTADQFTIGQLARQTNCKIPTIRYYEQIGLLPAPRRSPSNQRIYGPRHLARLTFIRQCRDLGFSQPSVRELLDLAEHPDLSCDAVTRIARSHFDEVEHRIARLSSLKAQLGRIIESCAGGRVENCRIMEALAGDDPSRAG